MGEQHKLIERLKSVRVGSAKWTNALNRLLDAARTEGRGEGQPVAWAYEYTNHLKGDRAPGGWLRAVAFEAPTRARVNAGFARNVQPLYASPIREPEISREAVEAALVEYEWALSTAGWPKTAAEITARTVDAILNLAPVGLKADFTKALPGGALDDTTFGAVEDALDRADAPMQAENGRWLTLPERIAALALEPQGLSGLRRVRR